MAAFHQPLPGVPFDSATMDPTTTTTTSRGSAAAFQWVACNSSKPGRPIADGGGGAPQCWVALTSPQRTQQLLERHPLMLDGKLVPQTDGYRRAVAAELLADFRALMQPLLQVG